MNKALVAAGLAAVIAMFHPQASAESRTFYLIETSSGSWVIDSIVPWPSNSASSGALCLEDAYSKTYDQVNLAITKKIWKCVLGPLGLKQGQKVHSDGVCSPNSLNHPGDPDTSCGVDMGELGRMLGYHPENARLGVFPIFLLIKPEL